VQTCNPLQRLDSPWGRDTLRAKLQPCHSVRKGTAAPPLRYGLPPSPPSRAAPVVKRRSLAQRLTAVLPYSSGGKSPPETRCATYAA
jgi:hypothetical protein